MTDREHSQLRQLLTGNTGRETNESGEFVANMSSTLYQSQDNSAANSTASLMASSNSLQDLVSLADGDSSGWFNPLQSNDFDFGSALLNQDQEQFGLGNMTMDDFTDQVLKSSANADEDNWIEANLPDHLSSNHEFSLNTGNQSDQLAESLVNMTTNQSADISPQNYAGRGAVGYHCELVNCGQLHPHSVDQQSRKSPLSVATNLGPSVSLNRYHSLPTGVFTDNEFYLTGANTAPLSSGSVATHCPISPTEGRLTESGSTVYPPMSDQLVSPAGSLGSGCAVRMAYSSSPSTTGDSVYNALQREGSSQHPIHSLFDSHGYGDPAMTLASPNQRRGNFDQTFHPTQQLHRSSYDAHSRISPNHQQPANIHISPSSHVALGSAGPTISPQKNVLASGVNPFSNMEYGWQNANQWQTPRARNPVNTLDQWLSPGQVPRNSYAGNLIPTSGYANHEILASSSAGMVSNQSRHGVLSANQMPAKTQFATHQAITSTSSAPTHADPEKLVAARRKNTEQSLRDCGLFEATMLTKRLVDRDKEVQSGMEDFKGLLSQFMQSLAVSDS